MRLVLLSSLLLTLLAGCRPAPEEGAFEGPGWSEEEGFLVEADQLLVGLTYLQVRNAPEPGNRFGELANTIGEGIYASEPEGWVGAAFRNQGKLHWWTMTVWESEEAMVDWMVSEHHGQAMQEIGDVAIRAKSTNVWRPVDELPMSWDEATSIIDGLDWYTHPKMSQEDQQDPPD